jgi:hypothetical protein
MKEEPGIHLFVYCPRCCVNTVCQAHEVFAWSRNHDCVAVLNTDDLIRDVMFQRKLNAMTKLFEVVVTAPRWNVK